MVCVRCICGVCVVYLWRVGLDGVCVVCLWRVGLYGVCVVYLWCVCVVYLWCVGLYGVCAVYLWRAGLYGVCGCIYGVYIGAEQTSCAGCAAQVSAVLSADSLRSAAPVQH